MLNPIVKRMIELQMGAAAPTTTEREILTEFDLDAFEDLLTGWDDALQCEAIHTEESPPCSITVTHRITATCTGKGGNICFNAARFQEAMMFILHVKCVECGRCAHDCWRVWAI